MVREFGDDRCFQGLDDDPLELVGTDECVVGLEAPERVFGAC